MKTILIAMLATTALSAFTSTVSAQSSYQTYTTNPGTAYINPNTFQYPRVVPTTPPAPFYVTPTTGSGFQNSWGGYAVQQTGGLWSFFGNWGQNR